MRKSVLSGTAESRGGRPAFHAARGGCRLTGRLGGELLPRGLASGALAGAVFDRSMVAEGETMAVRGNGKSNCRPNNMMRTYVCLVRAMVGFFLLLLRSPSSVTTISS
jgi:hypothetical protein